MTGTHKKPTQMHEYSDTMLKWQLIFYQFVKILFGILGILQITISFGLTILKHTEKGQQYIPDSAPNSLAGWFLFLIAYASHVWTVHIRYILMVRKQKSDQALQPEASSDNYETRT